MPTELTIALQSGLRLYYNILKLHRRVLPSKLRAIGDLYLRTEFKHHHQQPQLQFYSQFLIKWEQYHTQLAQQGLKAAKPLSPQHEQLLTADQKAALETLKKELQKPQ